VTPRRSAVLAAVVAVIAVVTAVVALTAGGRTAEKLLPKAQLIPASQASPAPELAGIRAFLNTQPVTMRELRGRVVLVDFWTYTCINCRRTFPFLRALESTYADHGLTVLGVHSPEFGFEKNPANVAAAVHRLDVTWPVAEDPDMRTWNAYANQYWPADYLVDREGRIRLVHYGEGGEKDIESAVRTLLDDGGSAGARTIGALDEAARPPTAGEDVTPESYFGWERGSSYLADARTVPRGQTVTRHDDVSSRDVVNLDGRFTGADEYVESAADGASVRLFFRARDLYLLVAPAGGAPRIEVLLDGRPVPTTRRGPDLSVDDGRTYLTVRSDELLHVLTSAHVDDGHLTLVAQRGVRFFTFTFGG